MLYFFPIFLSPLTDVPDSKLAAILDKFPEASRDEIGPHLMSILRLEYDSPARAVSTRRTRRLHFYMFLRNMHLNVDPFLERMSQRRRIYTMALYASHCCTGNTIRGKPIRTDTIKGYLLDVAVFIMCKTGIDPRFEEGQTTIAAPIQKVLDEYKRWEEQPDRRSPWTIAMQKQMDRTLATTQAGRDPHSLDNSIADWTALGLSAGLRRGEFMQPSKQHENIHNPERKEKTRVIGAFLLQDFIFYDIKGRRITNMDALLLAGLDTVSKLRITWRTQKNKKNGQYKTYLPNFRHRDLCPVARGLRIVQRYLALVGAHAPNVPLAVYRTTTNPSCSSDNIKLIFAAQLTAAVRKTAAVVLNLDPVKDAKELSLFSAHSLRVGACQILYAKGFSGYEIQSLLRWESLAFMVYLRDIAWVARKQSEAVADLADDEFVPFL